MLCCPMCNNVNDASIFEQIVYMPVETFSAPEVSSDPGFQPAQRAAGIYVVSIREMETAQLTNLHSCVLRQIYQ